MYGLLAEAGRAEDNAALGGQVAHISAAEADLLKRLGGAGTANPVTGLPEYIGTGSGVAGGLGGALGMPGIGISVASALGQGGNSVSTMSGRAALSNMGMPTTTTTAQYGGPRGNPPPSSNAPAASTATNQGLSVSPLASSIYGRVANIANSNIAADSGLVGKGLFGQLGHVLGKASTTGILGFLGDSGALGPAVQAMVRGTTTPPYGGEGSSAAGTSQGTSGENTAVIGGIEDTGLQVAGTGLPQNVTDPGISIV